MRKLYEPLLLLILITSAFLLGSCQKEVSNDPGNPNSFNSDSIYLSKVIFMDSSVGMGLTDTLYVWQFDYDAQKRVIKWSEYDYQSQSVINEDTYYYQGTDSLPYKKISSGGGPVYTAFFGYDNSGKILRDSVIGPSGTRVINYRSIAVGTEITERNYNSNTISVDTVLQTRQNGRLVSETDLSGPYTFQYQYDQNPNPYKRLNIFNSPVITYRSFAGLSDQTNNLTRVDFIVNSAMTTHTINWIYNNLGLPVRSNTQVSSVPGTSGDYIYFTYTD